MGSFCMRWTLAVTDVQAVSDVCPLKIAWHTWRQRAQPGLLMCLLWHARSASLR